MKNLALKVLSLVLALSLWFVVSAPRRERISERAFSAPISITALRGDLIITTPVPDNVTVRLRGRESDLRSLSAQNLEVSVDLSWASPGEAKITFHPQALNVPPEVQVVSIEPANVKFRVEQVRNKIVAIRPFLVGNPPTGYMTGTPTALPDRALIAGPLSQVRNLTEVSTERINMTGRTEEFKQRVAVVSDSSLVRVIDPPTTEVTVPVSAEFGPAAPLTGTATPAATDNKKP